MDNIDLVRFMQDLVSKPVELRKYKQDPATYLKHSHPHLDQKMHELLTNFSAPHRWDEISTVFRITIDTNLELASHIDFPDKLEVQLSAPNSSVIIEKTIEESGKDRPLRNILLSHSYIYLDEKLNVYFQLHQSYVSPHDHLPKPFMFKIATTEQVEKPFYNYNLTNAWTTMSITYPMVLVYNQTINPTFRGGSYDPSSGQIILDFDMPSADDNSR